ncbi:PQQ-binding-like beta-propeller repeat protein [Alphaproteobacteria bacterium]|nr:PQQ-binding-like beta-propeller repeat protein [Alphaproteobacteria bacterium]
MNMRLNMPQFVLVARNLYVARVNTSLSVLAGMVLLALAACSPPEAVLPGDRISVFAGVDSITADQQAFDQGAGLAVLSGVASATHAGGSAAHSGGHLDIDLPLKKIWSASIGGGGNNLVDLAQPVIDGGKVFAVTPLGQVTAIDVQSGTSIWSVSIETFDDDPLPGIGGGVMVNGEMLFVHAGGHKLAALSVDDGSTIWSIDLPLPIRGGPTEIDDQAIIITDIDGNLLVLKMEDGSPLWDRAGLPSSTIIYGTPSPAYHDGELAIAGAGGELLMLDATDGEMIWTESLAAFNPRTPLQGIGDIRANPVFDGGLVFAISQSGLTAAFNARSGFMVWDQPISGVEMPWVSGETVFVLSLEGRVYAIRREDGVVRWISELPGALPAGMMASEKLARYVGPIVANGHVMVIAKSGTLYLLNAETGIETGSLNVGSDVVTPPQIAGGRLFVLSNNGQLSAFE